ncbi:MAG: hypothetical protein ACYTGQ_08005 [Planctomycetota bacterium]
MVRWADSVARAREVGVAVLVAELRQGGGEVEEIALSSSTPEGEGDPALEAVRAAVGTLTRVVALTALGVWLSYTLYRAMPEDHRAPPSVTGQIQRHLDRYGNAQLLETRFTPAGESDGVAQCTITCATATPLPGPLIDDLALALADTLGHPVRVQINTRLVATRRAVPPTRE